MESAGAALSMPCELRSGWSRGPECLACGSRKGVTGRGPVSWCSGCCPSPLPVVGVYGRATARPPICLVCVLLVSLRYALCTFVHGLHHAHIRRDAGRCLMRPQAACRAQLFPGMQDLLWPNPWSTCAPMAMHTVQCAHVQLLLPCMHVHPRVLVLSDLPRRQSAACYHWLAAAAGFTHGCVSWCQIG
jgi:hypothetical protein